MNTPLSLFHASLDNTMQVAKHTRCTLNWTAAGRQGGREAEKERGRMGGRE